MHENVLWQVNKRFYLERVRKGVHWSRALIMVNTVKYVVNSLNTPHPPPRNQNKLKIKF